MGNKLRVATFGTVKQGNADNHDYLYPTLKKWISAEWILAKSETSKIFLKGWLAIAKLKPLSLFFSILLMLKKAPGNVKIEK